MEGPEKVKTSEWKRPDQVMELHRLKVKKRALQARINNICVNQNDSTEKSNRSSDNLNQYIAQKRKNPFAKDEPNKKINITPPDLETSNDNTLFELLHIEPSKLNKIEHSTLDYSLTFSNALSKLQTHKNIVDTELQKGEKYIPIDWTLKTKMRFMSPKPFPWNCKLKTSEEASGTTGFVRCLDIGEKDSTLDTSPNAR